MGPVEVFNYGGGVIVPSVERLFVDGGQFPLFQRIMLAALETAERTQLPQIVLLEECEELHLRDFPAAAGAASQAPLGFFESRERGGPVERVGVQHGGHHGAEGR